MLLYPRDWIHRRKEVIEFLDENRVQRRVSVDFTVPAEEEEFALSADHGRILPLSLLAKAPLKGFDVRDESGAALPALTRMQNGEIAVGILTLLAMNAVEQAFGAGTRLDQWICRDVADVALEEPDAAQQALSRVALAQGPGSQSQRRVVWNDDLFQPIAVDLALLFVLFVELNASPGDRRVIKFSYQQEIDPWSLERSEFLGLSPVVFTFPAPAIGDAQSYHAEAVAPYDLIIEHIQLRDLQSDSSWTVLSEDQNTDLGHVLTADRPRGSLGLIDVELGLRAQGVILGALIVSAVSASLLTTGVVLHLLDVHRTSAEAGTALLVALPGVYATLLVRPGEHRLAQRLVGGFKFMVLMSAAASFVAAGSLVVSFESSVRLALWIVLAVLSIANAALIVAPFLRIRRRAKS